VEGLVEQEPPGEVETRRPLLVEGHNGYHWEEALPGWSAVLRLPLEAEGRDGLEGVGSRVPSHQKAEVRRVLVGRMPVVVGHTGWAPHPMEERKRLLLPQVVEAAFLRAVPQSPDEERRDQWPVVAQPNEDELRMGSAVARQKQDDVRIQGWEAGVEEKQGVDGVSLPLVEEERQPVVVTTPSHGQLEAGEHQL